MDEFLFMQFKPKSAASQGMGAGGHCDGQDTSAPQQSLAPFPSPTTNAAGRSSRSSDHSSSLLIPNPSCWAGVARLITQHPRATDPNGFPLRFQRKGFILSARKASLSAAIALSRLLLLLISKALCVIMPQLSLISRYLNAIYTDTRCPLGSLKFKPWLNLQFPS